MEGEGIWERKEGVSPAQSRLVLVERQHEIVVQALVAKPSYLTSERRILFLKVSVVLLQEVELSRTRSISIQILCSSGSVRIDPLHH